MTTTLDIHLNGSRYPVACTEAEAPRVKAMAAELQQRIGKLHQDLGGAQVSDAHLMALMGLMLVDEIAELKTAAETAETEQDEVEAIKAELKAAKDALEAAKTELELAKAAPPMPEPVKTDEQDNEELFINAVTHLTERVNSIAKKLRAA